MSDELTAVQPGMWKLGDVTILAAGQNTFFVQVPSLVGNTEIEYMKHSFEKVFPGAKVVIVRSDGEASYTPLDKSPELRALITEIVHEVTGKQG